MNILNGLLFSQPKKSQVFSLLFPLFSAGCISHLPNRKAPIQIYAYQYSKVFVLSDFSPRWFLIFRSVCFILNSPLLSIIPFILIYSNPHFYRVLAVVTNFHTLSNYYFEAFFPFLLAPTHSVTDI